MPQAVVVVLASVTSAGAVLIGVRGLGLPWSCLSRAARRALECVGTILILFGANLLLGLGVIWAVRSLTGAFVSTYAVNDAALLAISCFQGLVFHCWREVR